MVSNELYIEQDGPIATLIINRPEKRNAFTLAMFERLTTILEEIENDPSIKVLLVRGVDESAFASGADISEFMDNRFSVEKAKHYNDKALEGIDKLTRFKKPTIAVIRSFAIGGGLELANACDFRFASEDSRLGITASRVGIVYNLASTKRLVDIIGPAKAKELLFTSKLISAKESQEIGLVHYIYSGETVLDEATAFASLISSRSSVANNGMKQVIRAILDGANEEDEELSNLILESFHSEDYIEGINAFLEKRKPNFN
ncbi:enoyl-CoA hydratase/isomerase family protein [Bacillus sp. REN16]|uniref:enoyl-CoA hydratase/isomerase family protein n=1 Tax=Bacillus sp. REN16 TaxID=2887296 RepID=UPI001E4F7261|nr:enoyl-CoA hydratase-related protein [Bacillus sp. REN16]MCC3358125.1 enoyl-CoA hydratase/isomerase family protein [Bacillus sp. REN16]